MPECIHKNIGGNWLVSGHLEACILKTQCPTEDEYSNDESRLENVAIVKRLLDSSCIDGGILKNEVAERPAIVLAPELAFGSPDFDVLDALIKKYEKNIIFICGFGFSAGSELIDISNRSNVEGIWNAAPQNEKKYNGGWVWIKNENSAQCYIFIKNYPEQAGELTVPNLGGGNCILRLESEDLVIFPLICADLVCKENDSPSDKICKSIEGSGTANKRLLITGSLLNEKSESGHWKAAIGDLLERLKMPSGRLMLSNCVNPIPVRDEDIDRWRCLSGVFQHRERCKSPKKALPNLRYVDDTKFAGLVLRNTVIGAALGKLKWTNNPSEGLHAFSECIQYIWKEQDLKLCDGICEADELYRFILRHRGHMLHDEVGAKDKNKEVANIQIESLINELSPASTSRIRKVAQELFKKCLKGIVKSASCCPDRLHEDETNLSSAITVVKLIQMAVDANLLPELPSNEKLEYGQLLSVDGEHEVLVWDSKEYTANELFNKVKEDVVKEGGSARPLTIVGKGKQFGSIPEDGRIRSSRLADISSASNSKSNAASSGERDICESSDRVVYWKNQSKIDDALISTEDAEKLKEQIKQEIALPEA